MILDILKEWYDPGISSTPVILTKFNNFLDDQWFKQLTVVDRYNKLNGVESNGVRLLHQILDTIDLKYLNSQANDYDRYNFYLKFISDNLTNIFDMNSAKREYKNMFIAGGLFNTPEYILPISSEDYLKTLPFTKGWLDWAPVQPVRLLNHDSEELSLRLIHGNVAFKGYTPSYAVIGIDVIALSFKYYKYVEEFGNTNIVYFVHSHILSGFFSDLSNIWLRNICLQIIGVNSIQHIPPAVVFDKTFGAISSQYNGAVEEIFRLFQNISDGKTKPHIFFQSINFQGYYGESIPLVKYLNSILETAYIPPLRQYLWQSYFRENQWIELIIKVFMLNSNDSNTKQMRKKLTIKMNLAANTRFWENITDTVTKAILKNHFQYIKSLL